MITITSFSVHDVRFPTSLTSAGSDAMNPDGDYSAAYIILKTDCDLEGHGMTFTIGMGYELRMPISGDGNQVVVEAIRALAPRLVDRTLDELTANMGNTWRYLSLGQIRWIGPEKGVIHLALAAVINALWDLWAKSVQKPVWKLVSEFTPEEFIRCIDFRYITDAITQEESIKILNEMEAGKEDRIKDAEKNCAVPAYTTSAGWLGYDEKKVENLLQKALEEGYTYFKLKVGEDINKDKKRLSLAREVIGYDKGNTLMVDANQVWDVQQAVDYMKELADFKPWFIEEPTSPDDILGHATIRKELEPLNIAVATGEHCHSRVMFKQLFQAESIDIAQIDSCRLGGVNEVLAVLLMAKKFAVPIVPHSGGIGLPEYTSHLAIIDYVCLSGKKSVLEYVDHLHEHFLFPAKVQNGYYKTPKVGGYSVQMKPDSLKHYEIRGIYWQSEEGRNVCEKRDRTVRNYLKSSIYSSHG
ncbi:L-galactonate dehydratase [Neolecta irregularis DAH-3]|uniref:L-galactonate dehydratase n=1 Tax=Neolecta irregularis (strain DAH-3) TaxID=1198029 RepID=A0A1U7LVL4_NEOID|nr:L-galactonate dehydratase [Neolecta irregularis DAH-3]|eukprot:OLL26613.1 L-galactonate dehydratase [Neolecta irregularis DAH-3]